MSDANTDTNAVHLFAGMMIDRLDEKRGQGFGGWNDAARCTPEYLMACLYRSLSKGKLVDVANFAMMLEARGLATEQISYLAARSLLGAPKEGV